MLMVTHDSHVAMIASRQLVLDRGKISRLASGNRLTPERSSMLTYVLKTLWRHRTRTLLTVTGAAVAMFVFCFVGSVQEGLHRLTTGQTRIAA